MTESGLNGDELIKGRSITSQVWWPWLEGTSKRNTSTRFKGYHTFRKTRLRLRKQVTPLAEQRLQEFIKLMGG